MTVLLEYINRALQFSINSLTLVHYPTKDLQKGQDLLKQGVTIFTMNYIT